MPLPSTLYDLFQSIRLEGEDSVANRLIAEGLVDAAMEFCREGLRVRAIAPEPFRLRLIAAVGGADYGFCVHYTPGEETGAYVECPTKDTCGLRGTLGQVLYIVSGSTVDKGSITYRAKILKWFELGSIQTFGEQMLLQRTQGYFGA